MLLAVFREPAGYPRAGLHADLDGLDPAAVAASVDILAAAGVIELKRAKLYPSEQLRRLVALDVICF